MRFGNTHAVMQDERPLKRLTNICFERDREFWVSHAHRLIFLSIPKNANSFLRSVFVNNHPAAPSYDPARESVIAYHQRAGARDIAIAPRHIAAFPHYRRAVALRDPFSRLVSAFLDKIVKPAADPRARPPGPRYWRQVSRCHGRAIAPDTLTFRQFASHVLATPETRRNRHCRSQSHYLGRERFTFYGDLSDMRGMLQHLQDCGLDTALAPRTTHKRTRYARPGNHEGSVADQPVPALARLAAFPRPSGSSTGRCVNNLLTVLPRISRSTLEPPVAVPTG
tara:strand:- start:2221 stop:3063 length:843 start_codon:yes stop_codon:yes gene_type:complete